MTSRYTDRIKILEDAEIEELYGRPSLSHEERVHFFSLTEQERLLADGHHSLVSRVLFVLQAGYFKAKTLFFSFEFDDVREDVRHILQQHYPLYQDAELREPILRKTRHAQQRKILTLYSYRACGTDERADLIQKAAKVVRISAKPIYVFQALMQHLETHRIAVPGYSFMQDIVSRALADERGRLTGILDRHLNDATGRALDALYTERDGLYAVTPLKRDPKDFSRQQMRQEIVRCRSLEPLYRAAEALLPKLAISNDSIAYYAALLDYYTVQKLQQLPTAMARLYLLCFLQQRFRKINDNLIQALIYQVRKVETAAKALLQERLLTDRAEGSKNIQYIGQILDLFLDDSIDDSVAFRDIKRRAFTILERDKFKHAKTFLSTQFVDLVALEWDLIASLALVFKPHLRPLLQQLSFAGHLQDAPLLEAVRFLETHFKEGRSLTRCRFDQIPKNFIPQSAKPYIYEKDADGRPRIHPDKYEFLVYRLLRNRLEAGDIYVTDSLRFRSFDDDLIPRQHWQQNKEQILQSTDVPLLAKPMAEVLRELETELEALYERVNRRILSGENTQIKLRRKKGEVTWTLPYPSGEETVNDPFFDRLPQVHIAQLLQFVDTHCEFLDAFSHILTRYVKTSLDRQAVIACLIAIGTNVGLGKMGSISDLSYQTLFAAANNFFRLETLREANDLVGNATAKLPIFRHYNIDDVIHSSSDGQKFETQVSTIRSRHSPKYFGLKKGIVNFTHVANHVPVYARVIGANEHESHYVFDILYNNTTEIQPTIHSTDTHGTNEMNFAVLAFFGYQYAPRYKDLRGKMGTLYGFRHPSKYDEQFLLKPSAKLNNPLMLSEEDNIKHVLASLATKVTSQSVIIGKLSAYPRRNRTKRALAEWDSAFRSIHLLRYVDSPAFQRNIQRALNRGESYHKLVRAVAHANGGKLRARTDLEQQIWSECSRLLANCIIHYNACILSELLERAERRGDLALADRIKRVSPASWRQVNLLGKFNFREIVDTIDFQQLIDLLEATPEADSNPDD